MPSPSSRENTLPEAPMSGSFRLKSYKEWRLATKLLALTLGVLLPLVAITLGFVLPTMTAQLYAEKSASLKQANDLAISVIDDFKKQADAGKITLPEAQKQALDRLRPMRYGDNGYLRCRA